MTGIKKAPGEAVRGGAIGDLSKQPVGNNNIGDIFSTLAPLPAWVSYRLVWNPKRGKFDKLPFNGRHGLSTADPNDWMPLPAAIAIAQEQGLPGVGIVMGKDSTGWSLDGWRLVGLDFDDVNFDEFKYPFKTYWENSPSGGGLRAFVWVPEVFAERYKDCANGQYPHCSHAEVYLGTAPRFLTLTFDPLVLEPFARLEGDGLKWFERWLKPVEKAPSGSQEATPPITPGNAITLDRQALNADQRALIDGTGHIDRSAILHGLLIRLIDAGNSRDDVLATIVKTPTLWQYCLDHRHDDDARAAEFAAKEVEKAARGAARPNMAHLGEQLRQQLVIRGMEQQPMKQPDKVRANSPKRRLIADCELLAKAGPIDWLIKNYLEKDAIIEIFGDSGHFKTFIAFDIARSVASGQHWHGNEVHNAGPVLYVCGEGHNGLARRRRALEQKYADGPLPIRYATSAFGLTVDTEVEELTALIRDMEIPPVLIIIDTLARNFGPADENSTAAMNMFIDNIGKLRNGATVLIIHHTGHANKERARGAYSLHAGIDAEFKADFDADKGMVIFENRKMKDAPEPPPLYFMPKAIPLFRDGVPILERDGTQVKSIVLETGKGQLVEFENNFYKAHPGFAKGTRRERLIPALVHLADKPGCSVSELGEAIKCSKGSAHSLLTELRRADLVEPAALKLTAKGLEAAARLALKVRPDIMLSLQGSVQKKLNGEAFRKDGTETERHHENLL